MPCRHAVSRLKDDHPTSAATRKTRKKVTKPSDGPDHRPPPPLNHHEGGPRERDDSTHPLSLLSLHPQLTGHTAQLYQLRPPPRDRQSPPVPYPLSSSSSASPPRREISPSFFFGVGAGARRRGGQPEPDDSHPYPPRISLPSPPPHVPRLRSPSKHLHSSPPLDFFPLFRVCSLRGWYSDSEFPRREAFPR